MFLLELYIQDGRNQEELSERLKIDKGTTARALKKLEEQGFITRLKDECDKRSNKIYLTQKAIQENVYDILDEWNKKLRESLSKEEEEIVEKLLMKVCNNINL